MLRIIIFSLVTLILLFPQSNNEVFSITTITKPKRTRIISFSVAGIVDKVLVKEGDYVEKDTLLINLQNKEIELEAKQLEKAAKDKSQLLLAKLNYEHKRQILADFKSVFELNALSKKELELAEFEERQAYFQYKHEEQKSELAFIRWQIKLEEIKSRIKKSPITGFIENVDTHTDDVIKPGEELIKIIQINPLTVDVYIPIEFLESKDFPELKVGDKLKSLFKDKQNYIYKIGKITFISKEIDPSSKTQRIKIEFSNHEKRKSGETIIVQIPRNI